MPMLITMIMYQHDGAKHQAPLPLLPVDVGCPSGRVLACFLTLLLSPLQRKSNCCFHIFHGRYIALSGQILQAMLCKIAASSHSPISKPLTV